jgi:hypothetical protein
VARDYGRRRGRGRVVLGPRHPRDARGPVLVPRLNDFAIDAYQAKLTPVAEAVAVPFVAALGDTPLAFRLPSLLASVALVVLLVGFATRRWGRLAGTVAAALACFDYRSVYYAQTHRYVALTQLLVLAVVALLVPPTAAGAGDGRAAGPPDGAGAAGRGRRAGLAVGLAVVLAVVLAVLAIHGHLLAVLVFGPLALACARDDLVRAPRRFDRVAALGLVCAWGFAMLLVFRSVAIERFTVPPGVRGSLASTARAVLGLGPAVALLGLGARSRRGARRAPTRGSSRRPCSSPWRCTPWVACGWPCSRGTCSSCSP